MTFNQVVGGSRPPTLIPIEYFALGLEAIVEIEHSGLARFFDSRYREIMVFFCVYDEPSAASRRSTKFI